ncbi:hypothetical protein AB0J64_55325, partial [Nonomuraea sp. NPDC049695]
RARMSTPARESTKLRNSNPGSRSSSSGQTLKAADVYFFDDNDGVRLPASWKLQYWNGSAYVDVPGTYPIAINAYNHVTFNPISTTRLRVALQSGQASVGLLEVKAFT